MRGRIVSLQVGEPRTLVAASGREWISAITKGSVSGKVALGRENLEGDRQANRRYHGGPDKALCGYSAERYPHWRATLGLDLPFGAFGENLTVEGLTEDELCIGDVIALGEGGVQVQVSQPRQPCVNLSKRWGRRGLPRAMKDTGWTGFYTRVVVPGEIASGDTVILVERPHPGWTLLRANRLMYAADLDAESLTALRELTALSAEWKRILRRKLAKL